MQAACEIEPSAMAAILQLEDEKVEEICARVSATTGIVDSGQLQHPRQVVISGTVEAVKQACVLMKEAVPNGPLCFPSEVLFTLHLWKELVKVWSKPLTKRVLSAPVCPIYQNVDGMPHTGRTKSKKT